MVDKYEMTDIRRPDAPSLHRIRALRDIPSAGVKAGDLGGWIEKESNLSQPGEAWVSGNAVVFGNARVFGAAQVYGDALVSGSADVLHAVVMGSEPFRATLHRTKDGHALRIGCRSGTVPEFRAMIESDRWVEATPEQIELRRPEMLAFATMCEARIATWEYR